MFEIVSLGFLADKLGQYKIVLILATIANGLFHTLLLAVPIYREIQLTSPTQITWASSSNYAVLSPVNNTLCSPFMQAFSEDQEITSVISSCESIFNSSSNKIKCFASDSKSNSSSSFTMVECQQPAFDSEFQDMTLEEEQFGIKFTVLRNDSCSVGFELDQPISTDLQDEFYFKCLTNLTFPTGEIHHEGNNAETFWTYFLLRVIATMFMNSCFSLLDATTLAVVKSADKAEYGKERIWSVVGFGAVSPLAGLLVDQVTRSKGPGAETDYSAAFYVSNVLLVLNIVTYMFMNLKVEKPEKGMGK